MTKKYPELIVRRPDDVFDLFDDFVSGPSRAESIMASCIPRLSTYKPLGLYREFRRFRYLHALMKMYGRKYVQAGGYVYAQAFRAAASESNRPDLVKVGLTHRIKTLDGMIIDGKNRYDILTEEGNKPWVEEADIPEGIDIRVWIKRQRDSQSFRGQISNGELLVLAATAERKQRGANSHNAGDLPSLSDLCDSLGVSQRGVGRAARAIREGFDGVSRFIASGFSPAIACKIVSMYGDNESMQRELFSLGDREASVRLRVSTRRQEESRLRVSTRRQEESRSFLRMNIALGKSTKGKKKLRYVYFFQLTIGGPIKIGSSESPNERLKRIQVNCPLELRCLGYFAETESASEFLLHKRFDEHRMHGEWFDQLVLPDVMDLIKKSAVKEYENV